MPLHTALFWIIAGLTGLSALAVVLTQNIVRCAAWLLFTLAGVAALFFLLGADFVGSTQLIVYVGGILVLVVFGVMLTAQGPFITMKTGPAEWAISLGVGALLFGILAVSLTRSTWPGMAANPSMRNPTTSWASMQLGEAFLGIPDGGMAAKEGMALKSRATLTGLPDQNMAPARRPVAYLLPFEVASVHLLVVLIGAAYLARAKRRRGAVA